MADLRSADAAAAQGQAASRRAQRAAQARWLSVPDDGGRASSTTLAAIDWDELGHLPDWALGDAVSIERLVAHVGAWSQRAVLRQCIDGRVLAAVRARIGDAAFVALMTHDAADSPGAEPPEGVDAALAAMDARAQAVLLGAIAHGALREAVRERLFPDAPPLLRPDAAADAQALVALALDHLHQEGASA